MTNSDKLQAFNARKSPNYTFQDPDPNDPDVIMPEVKLTRWDKASRKLRDLLAKRDALPADHAHHTAAILDHQIVRARQAVKSAESDLTRKREGIDEWRAGDGRELYNANRRSGKGTPHADVGTMSFEQRRQHDKDGAADRAWRARCRKAGWSEIKIQAEFVVRVRAREAKRAAAAQANNEQTYLEQNPVFGMF
ncbi:hypothetical protein E4L95_01990 [Paracoccus liaowanqingii]|uniref:Uncharacterized protein n=1 Tax=Paracoccus liaowanqingii TaxID=2560053 RepID=A0A4Z1CSG0_9RHOB|nr:hypothetical protein [Paracoccus liaowanqingii]TGN68282.1 hypothetical protein E4L95_01990 [Paracoccus liaowanqingii]